MGILDLLANTREGYKTIANSLDPLGTYLQGAKDYGKAGLARLLQQVITTQNAMQYGTPEQKYEAVMNDPLINAMGGVAGMMVGPKAKGFSKMVQFSNMADQMPRAEISDAGMKLKITKFDPDVSYYLNEVIDHPELFNQYPQMKSLEVYPYRGTGGSYSNQIINMGMGGNKADTLLHEIQHAIQEKEGFAKGGNPNIPWRKEYANVANNPMDYYMKQAGEIEARDTASRMNLTPEQRLSQMPYASQGIPLDEWIVQYGGGSAMQIPPDIKALIMSNKATGKSPFEGIPKNLLDELVADAEKARAVESTQRKTFGEWANAFR